MVGAKKSPFDETVLLSTQNQRKFRKYTLSIYSSSIIDTITKTYSGCEQSGLGWFRKVWGGYKVAWVVWGGQVVSFHKKIFPFEVNLSFIG